MARTIFVANLPYTIDEPALRTLFETVGRVETARIAYDRGTQRHRGFGFVVMESDDEHERAIQAFAGHRLQGRELVVNEARPREAAGHR
jgi:RNA recognition motif-containing protein